jgi:3-isopropylmalate dehydratase small subunit
MMEKNGNISGRVWLLGNHVNTDLLHPPSWFSLDEEKMKNGLRVGMERLERKAGLDDSRDEFIIVAGENFGCGSSRETSVRALFAVGVKAIVAQSFARIFYRSLVNRGITPIVCRELYDRVTDGDLIRIIMANKCIVLNNSEEISFDPFDPHIKKILGCGGLIPYLENECESET